MDIVMALIVLPAMAMNLVAALQGADRAETRGSVRVFEALPLHHDADALQIRDEVTPPAFLHNKQIVESRNFSQFLKISVFDEGGVSYRMPDGVKALESSERQAMFATRRALKARPASIPGPFLFPSPEDAASRPPRSD